MLIGSFGWFLPMSRIECITYSLLLNLFFYNRNQNYLLARIILVMIELFYFPTVNFPLIAHKHICLIAHKHICLIAHKHICLIAHKHICLIAHKHICYFLGYIQYTFFAL